MKIKTFSCTQCGKCCHTLVTKDTEYDVPGFSVAPFIVWTKPTLILLPWERTQFPMAKPCTLVYDKKQNARIVLDYTLEGRTCPYVKDNTCMIYNDRPVRCRIYPCPMGEVMTKQPVFKLATGHCPAEVSKNEFQKMMQMSAHGGLKHSRIQEVLLERYGLSYVYHLHMDSYYQKMLQFLHSLHHEGKIHLAMDDYESIKVDIEEAKQVDSHTFIKRLTNQDVADLFSPMNLENTQHQLTHGRQKTS